MTEKKEEFKGKYFGTDGFRGEANVNLTAIHAFKIGRFLGWYYSQKNSTKRAKIVIGKDTRRSSYMLEYSIAAGVCASGADAYMLHVTTTPSVSYTARQDGFDCGVMITASHNPFCDNGIKVINRHGEKLEDETTRLIECYIDGDLAALGVQAHDLPLATDEKIGAVVDYASGRNRYVGYLISVVSNSFKDLKIGLDCANGASWMIAKSVFGALGAQLNVIGNEPDGLNVNKNCGSTHIERLQEMVRREHLDMGFAFDGDADRCIAVDEKGCVVDGDKIMFLLAKRLQGKGMLNKNTVAATVMSNSGFVKSLKKQGIDCELTAVGDRFVYECMQKNDYSIGGEQSGHIILKKYATTGDGILTALMVAEEICDKKTSLGELCKGVETYPQFIKNVRVADKEKAINDESVQATFREVSQKIGDDGRALLRMSGTEPVVRIMIEYKDENMCQTFADEIYKAMEKGGHINGN